MGNILHAGPVQFVAAAIALWAAFWSLERNTEHGIKRIGDAHRFLQQHCGFGLLTVCSGLALVLGLALAGKTTLMLASYGGNTVPLPLFFSLWGSIVSGYTLAGGAAYFVKQRI